MYEVWSGTVEWLHIFAFCHADCEGQAPCTNAARGISRACRTFAEANRGVDLRPAHRQDKRLLTLRKADDQGITADSKGPASLPGRIAAGSEPQHQGQVANAPGPACSLRRIRRLLCFPPRQRRARSSHAGCESPPTGHRGRQGTAPQPCASLAAPPEP